MSTHRATRANCDAFDRWRSTDTVPIGLAALSPPQNAPSRTLSHGSGGRLGGSVSAITPLGGWSGGTLARGPWAFDEFHCTTALCWRGLLPEGRLPGASGRRFHMLPAFRLAGRACYRSARKA